MAPRDGRLGAVLMRARPVMADSAAVVAAQLLSKGTLYLVAILVARRLPVQDFAGFNFFLVTTTLLIGYVGLGLPLAATRLLAPRNRTAATDEGVSAVVLLAMAATLLFLGAAPWLLPLLMADEVRLGGAVVAAGTVGGVWGGLALAGLYATGRFRAVLLPILVTSALFVAAAATAAALADVTVLLWGAVGTSLLACLAFLRLLAREPGVPALRDLRWPSRAALRDVLVIALPGLGINVVFVTFTWLLARTVLEHQVRPDQFNIFSLGMQWFALVLFVPSAVAQAVFPRYVRMAAGGNVPLRAVLLPTLGTAGALLAAVPVGMVAAPLVTAIYGGRYPFDPMFVGSVLLLAAVAGVQTQLSYFVIAFRGTLAWLLANVASLVVASAVLALDPPATAMDGVARAAVFHLGLLACAALFVWRSAQSPSGGIGAAQSSGDLA